VSLATPRCPCAARHKALFILPGGASRTAD
jgi:hypothetical protein